MKKKTGEGSSQGTSDNGTETGTRNAYRKPPAKKNDEAHSQPTNENLESELNTLLSQLATPSVRNMIFAIADALISGQPIPGSSESGGENSDCDLRLVSNQTKRTIGIGIGA